MNSGPIADRLGAQDGIKVSAEALYVYRDIAVVQPGCPYFENLPNLAKKNEYGWRIVHVIWKLTGGVFELSGVDDAEHRNEAA